MKTYLGDSVYADHDGTFLVLTTENGYGSSNTILLDEDVLDALLGFVARLPGRTNSARIEGLRIAEQNRDSLGLAPRKAVAP